MQVGKVDASREGRCKLGRLIEVGKVDWFYRMLKWIVVTLVLIGWYDSLMQVGMLDVNREVRFTGDKV